MGDDRADLDLLTEPTRRAIVGMLAERPRRASSIAEALGMSLAATSRHLRLLRDGGIVRAGRVARDGRVRLYMLHLQRTRPVMAWLAAAGLPIDDEDAPALPTSEMSRARKPRPSTGPIQRSRPLRLVAVDVGPFQLVMHEAAIRRVVPEAPVSAVPETPSSVAGIVDLDGELLPVVDLRHRLGLEEVDDQGRRLVVTETRSGPVAFRVDAVGEPQTVESSALRDVPLMAAGSRSPLVIGLVRLAGGVASMVDPDALADGLPSMQRTPPSRPPDSRS